MYICYLDESGTREPDANSSHFVLFGLAIPADTWKQKDAEIDAIKGKYDLLDKELHTAWMARDYPEQTTIQDFNKLDWEKRRKRVLAVRALNIANAQGVKKRNRLLKFYRKTDAYIHLTRTERKACLLDSAKLIRSWKDTRAFADAQDKRHTAHVPGFDYAFEQVVTRFNTFLACIGGPPGIIVQDNNETMAKRLTEAMRRYHRTGTLFRKLDKIVETPLFVDSELTSMIQLADLGSYATRRFFERNEGYLSTHVYRRFDRHGGRLVGLRHYTGTQPCQCRVCRDHGRNE